MESNVERTVLPADEPGLLARARVYDGLPYLEGIGFLYDRGSYMEVRYDNCHHSTNFYRDRMNFAQAADYVRAELTNCGTCDFQARVARAFPDT